MRIYFGEIEYDAEEVFEHDGVEYDFALKINEEGIVIEDTVGRIMPMSFKDTLQLMAALKKIKRVVRTKVMAERVEDMLLDAPDQCV